MTRYWESSQIDAILRVKSNWLDIESQVKLTRYWESSQIDSILRVKSNWLDIESQVKLTRYWESSQIKLTLNIEPLWLKYSPITRNSRSNFCVTSDSNFKVKLTQFFSVFNNVWGQKLCRDRTVWGRRGYEPSNEGCSR